MLMHATLPRPAITAGLRRPILCRDFRRGLRRYTMFNETNAYFDAHPEELAELMRISDEIERVYGPPPPIPRFTKFTLRGEVFPAASGRATRPATANPAHAPAS